MASFRLYHNPPKTQHKPTAANKWKITIPFSYMLRYHNQSDFICFHIQKKYRIYMIQIVQDLEIVYIFVCIYEFV